MPLIRKDPDKNDTSGAPSAVALDPSSEDSRWAEARKLAKDPAAVSDLAKALASETSPRVREAILTSLAHINTPEAISAILPYIRSDDAAIRTGALDALATMASGVEAHLPTLLSDPDPDVRLLVCEIVRHLPADVATRHLCALLANEQQANVCGAAVEALSEVGDASALPILAECADRFTSEPFLQFSIKAVSDRIAEDGRTREPKDA
jgi:HEAT repeat protein